MSLDPETSPLLPDSLSSELSTNGTQGSGGKVDVIIYSSVVAVTALFILTISLLVLLFCRQRAMIRRQVRQLVEDVPRNSYGSVSSYEQSHRHSVRYSSLGTRRPPIFILYALELGTYKRVQREDYPTYSLVLDLTNVLHALNFPCYHDGSEAFQYDSIQDFSSKVSRAVREAKAVIVVCSEVLFTVFRDTAGGGKKAQMKFGKFSVSRVSKTMAVSSGKFYPVTMTGVCSSCPHPLQDKRCFDLHNHEEFLVAARGSSNSAASVWRTNPQFSEFSELANKLRQL